LEGGPPRFSPRFTGADLLRNAIGRPIDFVYGTVALCGARFHALRLSTDLVTPAGERTLRTSALQPPTGNACALTPARFGLIPFRSPLLGESRLISFPRGTEMFQFPRLPPTRLCIQRGVVAVLTALGFPIRESAGHWLFSASPRLIAAVHALLRLLVPRHPPCALLILTVIRHLSDPKVLEAPGDTRLSVTIVAIATALAWLCSFQGPQRGAPPDWGLGLSKLNSMRPPARTRRAYRHRRLVKAAGAAGHEGPRAPGPVDV
jgi:hypothetical protein